VEDHRLRAVGVLRYSGATGRRRTKFMNVIGLARTTCRPTDFAAVPRTPRRPRATAPQRFGDPVDRQEPRVLWSVARVPTPRIPQSDDESREALLLSSSVPFPASSPSFSGSLPRPGLTPRWRPRPLPRHFLDRRRRGLGLRRVDPPQGHPKILLHGDNPLRGTDVRG